MTSTLRVPLSFSAHALFTAVGITRKDEPAPRHLELFLQQADRALDRVRDDVIHHTVSGDQATAFQQLLVDAGARVMCHPIVASNRYLERFAQGVTFAQARHELQQFSVFAAQFDVAQAKLVANAPTAESYRERLKVLLNEKGIPYENGFEGELTGRWSMDTVHFTWLRKTASGLDLRFEDLGKIWLAQPGTKAFVDATFRFYASTDPNEAIGASFGIENWAANNLWKPWIAGMKKLNAQLKKPASLGYLTYHDSEEEHHSQATIDELMENFFEPWFDAERFLTGAENILNEGVQPYYESQLATLPEKDGSWPEKATLARGFDPHELPRLERDAVIA